MTLNKTEEPSYNEIEFDECQDINDQNSDCSKLSCHSSSGSIKEDPQQCTKEVPSGKWLRMRDEAGMKNDVNSFDNDSYKSDEGPLEKTRSWFHSKFNFFKIPNSLQNVLPSTIPVTRQDSSDSGNVPKFASIDQEKRSIIKNLLVISITSMVLSTAFQSMSALHSNFGILHNTFGLSTVSNGCPESYQFNCKVS